MIELDEFKKQYVANYQNRLMDLLIGGYLGVRKPTEKEAQEEFNAFVKPMLDEAHKEFPKLPENPNTADRINHSIECLEWFMKWFSDQ